MSCPAGWPGSARRCSPRRCRPRPRWLANPHGDADGAGHRYLRADRPRTFAPRHHPRRSATSDMLSAMSDTRTLRARAGGQDRRATKVMRAEEAEWATSSYFHEATAGRKYVELVEQHAAEFAARAELHDREGSFPVEAFEAMKGSSLVTAAVAPEFGGLGVSSLHDLMVGLNRLGRADGWRRARSP